MCEQCSANTVTLGEVFPGWDLVRATQDGNFMKKGDFGLVTSNDPDYYWKEEPKLNPCFLMNHEEFINYEGEDWDEFDELCEKISKQFNNNPATGYYLTKTMIENGLDPNNKQPLAFFQWLVHKIAEVYLKNKLE